MEEIMPIEVLFGLIENDPLQGAEEARKRYKGVRRLNWEIGASGYALAKRLAEKPDLLKAFYSQEFWDEGYEKDPTHLLRHCCQYVIGVRKGSNAKRAENWASAMQPTFDTTTISPTKLLEMLTKGGGFDGLRKDEARAEVEDEEDKDKEEDEDEEEDKDKEEEDEDEDNEEVEAEDRIDPPKPRSPKMTMKQVFEHLLVKMEPHELQKFLDGQSDVGEQFEIMVKRQADMKTGVLVWRAMEIKPLDPPID